MKKLIVAGLIALFSLIGLAGIAGAAPGHHYHHYRPHSMGADMYGHADMYAAPDDMY